MDQPKIIRVLDKSGNIAGYPLTITRAVIDLESQEPLDIILEELRNGAVIVKDNALQYHLAVRGKQSGEVIDLTNTWLDSVTYDYNSKKFKFIFSTRQGKTTIYIDSENFINRYYADEQTITLCEDTFMVKPNVFASAESGNLAKSALQNIIGDSNTEYMQLSTSEKVGDENNKNQTIHAEVKIGSLDSDNNGFALVQDVRQYVQGISVNNCKFENVNNINYPDISSYLNG